MEIVIDGRRVARVTPRRCERRLFTAAAVNRRVEPRDWSTYLEGGMRRTVALPRPRLAEIGRD